MALISFSSIADGTTGTAAQVNTPLTTIYNDYNGNITNANLAANAAIAQSKLSLALTGAQAAIVVTGETTASLAYVQLATTTDQVTVTIGASGLALVCLSAFIANTTANSFSYVSFAVSGATTSAASDASGIIYQAYANNAENQMGNVFLITGLSAGSNTFKMQYHVSGGTGTFQNRRIAVVPL